MDSPLNPASLRFARNMAAGFLVMFVVCTATATLFAARRFETRGEVLSGRVVESRAGFSNEGLKIRVEILRSGGVAGQVNVQTAHDSSRDFPKGAEVRIRQAAGGFVLDDPQAELLPIGVFGVLAIVAFVVFVGFRRRVKAGAERARYEHRYDQQQDGRTR